MSLKITINENFRRMGRVEAFFNKISWRTSADRAAIRFLASYKTQKPLELLVAESTLLIKDQGRLFTVPSSKNLAELLSYAGVTEISIKPSSSYKEIKEAFNAVLDNSLKKADKMLTKNGNTLALDSYERPKIEVLENMEKDPSFLLYFKPFNETARAMSKAIGIPYWLAKDPAIFSLLHQPEIVAPLIHDTFDRSASPKNVFSFSSLLASYPKEIRLSIMEKLYQIENPNNLSRNKISPTAFPLLAPTIHMDSKIFKKA